MLSVVIVMEKKLYGFKAFLKYEAKLYLEKRGMTTGNHALKWEIVIRGADFLPNFEEK